MSGSGDGDDAAVLAGPAAAAAVIRGIYAAEEEADPDFVEVATFADADACTAWLAPRVRSTNPKYPEATQMYTTLCDWEQVQGLLLRKLAGYRARLPHRPLLQSLGAAVPAANLFAGHAGMLRQLAERLDLPFHARTSEDSTLNTLRYLFFHMKCGVFVLIRRGRLQMFVPFVNKDYRNTWGDAFSVEGGSVDEFLRRKRVHYRRFGTDDYIPDVGRWWANGNMICNVDSPGFWGDAYLPQLRHMLQTLCARRAVPDCEFFINKRDFPQLKRNLTEPHDFVYDRDDVPLARERYASYAPIASFFVGAAFADLPLVTTDDWETATGRVFPPAAKDLRSAANRALAAVPWEARVPTAFFRGNSTGLGSDPASNQRLALAQLSHAWRADRARGAGNALDGVPFLDAGVTGFSTRDRKAQGQPMTFFRGSEFGFSPVAHVPMYEQMRFRYHIYIDGHCAAMRYVSMLPLGATIIKVASRTKADSMWFFPLLVPYDIASAAPDPAGDHIPVRADLSDLGAAIAWLKTHDTQARAVAANSAALYERLVGLEGQLDYMQLLTWEIARRFTSNAERAEEGGGDGTAVTAAAAAVTAVAEAADANSAPVVAPAAAAAAVPPLRVPAFAACPARFAAVAARPTAAAAAAGVSASAASSSSSSSSAMDFGGEDAAPGASSSYSSGDWFGADSAEYADVRIGPSSLPCPRVDRAPGTARCDCPSCAAKVAAREAAAAAAAAVASSASAAAAAASSGGFSAGGRGGGGSGGAGSMASMAAAAGFGAAPTVGQRMGAAAGKGHPGGGVGGALAHQATGGGGGGGLPDRVREAAARAAALAKQKGAEAAARASAAAGPSGRGGGGGGSRGRR